MYEKNFKSLRHLLTRGHRPQQISQSTKAKLQHNLTDIMAKWPWQWVPISLGKSPFVSDIHSDTHDRLGHNTATPIRWHRVTTNKHHYILLTQKWTDAWSAAINKALWLLLLEYVVASCTCCVDISNTGKDLSTFISTCITKLVIIKKLALL